MSGVPLEPVYGPDDAEFPGQWPYTRGPYASMYRSRLWTMRQFAGFGTAEDTNGRFKELLRLGRERPVHRLRHAHPPRPGLRRPPRQGRGRPGRGGHRHPERHGDALRRHRPRDGQHLDDHQLGRPGRDGHVRRGRRPPGGGARRIERHDPERHLEGVPGPEGVRVPAAALGPPGHRRGALRHRRAPAMAPGLGLRLPHPRGGLDGRPGARLHPGQRVRLRRGGLAAGLDVDEFAPRLSFFFNAHIDFFEEIAKYRAARRIWARWMRDRYGATEHAIGHAALPHPDRRASRSPPSSPR